MNQEFEIILDRAIQLLAEGKSVEFIVKQFPKFEHELLETLPIVTAFNAMPHKAVPRPTPRHSYARTSWSWFTFTEFLTAYKFAFAPLLLLAVLASGFTLNKASENSLPGQVLYSIKSAKERAQVTLTFDQKKLATLHMELSQKRLEEVKRAIETNNPEQEVAALNNLTEQTEKTLDAISQIATDPNSSQENHELIDNLVAINKEQKSLIQAATESSDTKEEATIALTESKETDINLAKLIATVNEQTLMDLPNKISVTGIVITITDAKVTVEKNTFSLNNDTVIVSTTGEITTATDIKGKISVIGTTDNNTLVAKKIIIIDPDAKVEASSTVSTPQVKGRVTTTPSGLPPKPAVIPSPETDDETITPPTEAYGGFIAEPADSQYLQ